MFNFCPSCASKNIKFEEGKVFKCPDCDFVYFHNIAAANGCIISVPDLEEPGTDPGGEKIVLLVRNRDPGKGKLDLPGGFVDIGEGAVEGCYRELKEELGWSPAVPPGANLAQVFKMFASFSNVYKYKGIDYNTCDLFFSVSAPGLKPEDLHLEEDEVSGVLFLGKDEIDYDQIAFDSIRRAIQVYFNKS